MRQWKENPATLWGVQWNIWVCSKIIPCQLSFKLITHRTPVHQRSHSPHSLIFLISRPRRTRISKNIHAIKVTGQSVTSGLIISLQNWIWRSKELKLLWKWQILLYHPFCFTHWKSEIKFFNFFSMIRLKNSCNNHPGYEDKTILYLTEKVKKLESLQCRTLSYNDLLLLVGT